MVNAICPSCKGTGCVVCGNSGSCDDELVKARIDELKKDGNLSEGNIKEVK